MENIKQFLNRVNTQIASLPNKQRKICDFFLDHYREVPFLSVQQIAKETKTSATSVLRVVQGLGYDFFKELQRDIQAVLYQETPDVFSFRFSHPPTDAEDSFTYIIESNRVDLQNNLSDVNKNSFDGVVRLLERAGKIAFLGLRVSGFVASYMYSMMSMYRDNCILLQSNGSEYIYDKLQFLGPSDMLFAVSMGGPNHTGRTIDAIKYAKKRGVPVVLLTSTATNAAVEFADLFFIASPSNYLSVVSAMSIAEALLFEFFKRRKELIHDSGLAETLIEQNILMKSRQ